MSVRISIRLPFALTPSLRTHLSRMSCAAVGCGCMQGVLAVYDVTNKKSFEHVEEWMKALREVGFLYLYFSCDHDPG
jgi:hypothetical protein